MGIVLRQHVTGKPSKILSSRSIRSLFWRDIILRGFLLILASILFLLLVLRYFIA
jgi:hypothetical protein